MNTECDPYFNQKIANWKPNQSMGLIFGFENEIVYHQHFSAIYTFKQYSMFMTYYTSYEYHPFEKGTRMTL